MLEKQIVAAEIDASLSQAQMISVVHEPDHIQIDLVSQLSDAGTLKTTEEEVIGAINRLKERGDLKSKLRVSVHTLY